MSAKRPMGLVENQGEGAATQEVPFQLRFRQADVADHVRR